MKSKKYFLFATALVLLAGLCFGAMAQDRMQASDFRLPPEPINPTVKLNAIEITDGIVGVDNQTKLETVFGYSFLGQTTGSLPGSFTLSMNCTPAVFTPGEKNETIGGSWTLPVYATDLRGTTGYAGSLYGTVAKGTMNWGKTGASVFLVLNVDGGTLTWEGTRGYATFVGTISFDEKTGQTTLNGDMVFSLISAVVK